jgi:hypothetical protein
METGVEIAGSAAGASIGLVFAGPVGALGGAAAAPVITRTIRWVADEMACRVLGMRERVRAGAALIFAAERFARHLKDGHPIRDDGFFQDRPGGRNSGREVVEGVLQAARRSFEERKIRHLGYLFANVAFTSNVDPGLANHTIGIAESLSWRQFLLLAALGAKDQHPLPDGDLHDEAGAWTPWGVRRELAALCDQRLVGAPPRTTSRYGFSYENTQLRDLRLSQGGRLLHYLLDLVDVPDADLADIRRLLEPASTPWS